jgi:hypothetical protein
MGDWRESRVSQGGEGRIRRGTPEEIRALRLKALREGRSDVQTQRGWDLAMEETKARGEAAETALAETRKALEFYADSESWRMGRGALEGELSACPPANQDQGALARSVLAKYGEDQ